MSTERLAELLHAARYGLAPDERHGETVDCECVEEAARLIAQGVRVGAPSIREVAAKHGIPLTEHDIPPDIGGVPPSAADYEGVRVGDDGRVCGHGTLIDGDDNCPDCGAPVIYRVRVGDDGLRAALAATYPLPEDAPVGPSRGPYAAGWGDRGQAILAAQPAPVPA